MYPLLLVVGMAYRDWWNMKLSGEDFYLFVSKLVPRPYFLFLFIYYACLLK